jgi:hypothetical protein
MPGKTYECRTAITSDGHGEPPPHGETYERLTAITAVTLTAR